SFRKTIEEDMIPMDGRGHSLASARGDGEARHVVDLTGTVGRLRGDSELKLHGWRIVTFVVARLVPVRFSLTGLQQIVGRTGLPFFFHQYPFDEVSPIFIHHLLEIILGYTFVT